MSAETRVETPAAEVSVDAEEKEASEKKAAPDFMEELHTVLDAEVAQDKQDELDERNKLPESKAPDGKSKVSPTVDADKGGSKLEPKAGEDPDDEQKGDGEKAPVVDDALSERAVRAGLSLVEVKAFGSKDALESVVGRLETAAASLPDDDKAGKGKGDEKDGKKDDGKDDDDLLASIPDLDPDEYDEGIVNAFKAMKNVAAKQQEIIGGLKQQVADGVGSKSGVDVEIAKLGKDYEGVFDGEASRSKLDRHVEFARSEAAAEGKEISDSDAFKQAVATGFGEQAKKVKGTKAREAAAKRSKTAMNQSRTSDGSFSKTSDDPMTEPEREDDAIAAVRALMEGN